MLTYADVERLARNTNGRRVEQGERQGWKGEDGGAGGGLSRSEWGAVAAELRFPPAAEVFLARSVSICTFVPVKQVN
jgi:hypothetical protein